MARSARCVLMARSARCHVRRRGSALSSRHSVGFSCRSAARTSRVRIALGSRLLRHRSVTNSVSGHSSSARRRAIRGFDCSLRSLRIALDSRLLRRRSPTKSVSARSSSARRRAIRDLPMICFPPKAPQRILRSLAALQAAQLPRAEGRQCSSSDRVIAEGG